MIRAESVGPAWRPSWSIGRQLPLEIISPLGQSRDRLRFERIALVVLPPSSVTDDSQTTPPLRRISMRQVTLGQPCSQWLGSAATCNAPPAMLTSSEYFGTEAELFRTCTSHRAHVSAPRGSTPLGAPPQLTASMHCVPEHVAAEATSQLRNEESKVPLGADLSSDGIGGLS